MLGGITMSLRYVILGFLNIESMTGYDLKKKFDRTVSGIWPADQSQIYRTLTDLKRQGLVSRETIQQETRPNRRVNHITDGGRDVLHEWMLECEPGSCPRSAFLVQLYFAGLLEDEAAIHLLEGKAERIRRKLASFPEKYQLSAEYYSPDPPKIDFFEFLPLDYGVHMRYAFLEWIEGAIQRIRSKDYEKGREGAITRWPPYTGSVGEKLP